MSTDSIAKEVESMINKYDKDGDRKINFDEIVNRMKEVGAKDPITVAFHIMGTYDTDGSGYITQSEIETQRLKIQQKKNEKMLQKDVKKMLSQFDNNKDGKITFDEALSVFKADPDCSNPILTTNYLFERIDSNNDKVITRAEVKQHLESGVFGPLPGPQQ